MAKVTHIPSNHEKQENTSTSNLHVLISGTGDISVEPVNDKFRILSGKHIHSTEENEHNSEAEARSAAIDMMYVQLKAKFEKSIRSENLVVLTGAGSSVECGGPSMKQLWGNVSEDKDITEDWDSFIKSAGYHPESGKENLEQLLSNLQTITRSNEIDASNGHNFTQEIKKIETRIVQECKKVNVSSTSPQVRLLSRILKARGAASNRLKVFTLNYDTAFEQAATDLAAVFIDGFLFSYNKSYNSTEFDLDIVQRERSRIHFEENFYSKVFHLYKIHGSIDWSLDSENANIIKDSTTIDPLLIYPNSSKFEKSFEMPFFEMLSRLQTTLRKENTTLFVIGYGFGDQHINRIIMEAVKNNLNLEVFVVKRTLKGDDIDLFKQMIQKGSMNIHLVGSSFDRFASGLPDVSVGRQMTSPTTEKGDE